LLIYEEDGPSKNVIRQLEGGVLTEIATGTQYEMRQKADELEKAWIDDEGFRSETASVFEPFDHAIALLKNMGYTAVFDDRYKNMDPRRGAMNGTGKVPLSKWPGVAGRNGEKYQYSYEENGTLRACPIVPPRVLKTAADILAAKAAQESIGPSFTFLLCD
jgi:hypothetical protein